MSSWTGFKVKLKDKVVDLSLKAEKGIGLILTLIVAINFHSIGVWYGGGELIDLRLTWAINNCRGYLIERSEILVWERTNQEMISNWGNDRRYYEGDI